MSITALSEVTLPDPIAGDWGKLVSLIDKSFQNINSPLQIDIASNLVPVGATFRYLDKTYYAGSTTTITGTTSAYVKLTLSGSDLIPTYALNLTGVAWDTEYNGYYDASNNMYIFDEVAAVIAGAISEASTVYGKQITAYINQSVKTTDSPTFKGVVCTDSAFHIETLPTEDSVFNALSSVMPEVGDTALLSGGMTYTIYSGIGAYDDYALCNLSYAVRTATDRIQLYYTVLDFRTNHGNYTINTINVKNDSWVCIEDVTAISGIAFITVASAIRIV